GMAVVASGVGEAPGLSENDGFRDSPPDRAAPSFRAPCQRCWKHGCAASCSGRRCSAPGACDHRDRGCCALSWYSCELLDCNRKRLAPSPRRSGGGVDALLRNLREHLVHSLLLLERLLEQAGGVGQAQALGQVTGGAVAGDFVVLDPLAGADEGGILH